MKNTIRTAPGVLWQYLRIVAVVIVVTAPASALLSSTLVKASRPTVPHQHSAHADSADLAMVAKQRRMPYSPARQPDKPALWTVRSRFDELIQGTARRHDVDPYLVKAIVQAESAFNPEAVSRSGARGLMQVLPTTASRFSIENLSDPRQNLRAGVLYLKYLLELFDGDVTKAVAAYNAGPNSVRRYRGVPPYNETRNYLTKVMGLREAYADPSRRS